LLCTGRVDDVWLSQRRLVLVQLVLRKTLKCTLRSLKITRVDEGIWRHAFRILNTIFCIKSLYLLLRVEVLFTLIDSVEHLVDFNLSEMLLAGILQLNTHLYRL